VYIGIDQTIDLIRTSFPVLERCFSFSPLSFMVILSHIKPKLSFFYRPTIDEKHVGFFEICTRNKNNKLFLKKTRGPNIPLDKFKVI
jgi:hypothetical protein